MTERTGSLANAGLAWRAVATVGVLLFLIGLITSASAWYPLQVGKPEWEFGTTSDFFDTFPLLGLGLVLLIAHGVAGGRKLQVRTLATACVLIAVGMWLAFTLFATTFPMVLNAVKNPAALTSIKKAGAKTLVQAAVYPFALLWLAGAAWKATLRRRGRG